MEKHKTVLLSAQKWKAPQDMGPKRRVVLPVSEAEAYNPSRHLRGPQDHQADGQSPVMQAR